MSLGGIGNVFNLMREVNLSQIKKEAEREFRLLVTGDDTLAPALAAQLDDTHPGVEVERLPLPRDMGDLSRYTIALVVGDDAHMSEGEKNSVRRLREADVPVVIVVVSETVQQREEVPASFGATRIYIPSLDRDVLHDRLAPAVVRALPDDMRLALARQLPLLRWATIHELIEETSRTNGLYSASTGLAQAVPLLTLPLGAADVVVLTKNQLTMAYKIALVAGKEGSPRALMGEVAGVLGGGLLFRQVARQLVGLIPVAGIVPKVAVAYAGTRVIGNTAALWAMEGERLTGQEMRQFYSEALARGRAVANELVSRVRRDKAQTQLPPPEGGDELAVAREQDNRNLWQRVRGRLPF
jgi:uncharacterized protein (DUF697 family)